MVKTETITIGEIADLLKFVAGLIASCGTIYGVLKVTLNKTLGKQLKPINDTIKSLDENQCKNFLVRSFADLERGVKLDEIEIQRMYDAYDHYCKDLKGNSYIHAKWEKLMGKR